MADIFVKIAGTVTLGAVGFCLYALYEKFKVQPTQPVDRTYGNTSSAYTSQAYRSSAELSSRHDGYHSPSYNRESTNRVSTTSYRNATTGSDIEYLTKLKNKAIEFLNDRRCTMKPISDMYRNLPAQIFNRIRRQTNGIMTTRLKDNHGDPKSTINGKINGLFFMATHNKDGSRPEKSPFGDMRMVVPIERFFNGSYRLYFADFYCNGPNRPHYVTLVLTKRGSTADRHCSSNALELDLKGNPFFQKRGLCYCLSGGGLWVEVFYTENMSLDSPNLEWETVETIGRGRATKTGFRKDPLCSMCNIDSSSDFSFSSYDY